MPSSEERKSDEGIKPSEEALRQQLDIQWRDHFQTREQTWRALQVVAVLLLGVIGADISLHERWTLVPLAAVLGIASAFGVAVTVHHRRVQVQKFRQIFRLEEMLGLHAKGLLEGVREPEQFRWRHVVDVKMATPTFILIIHLLFLAFTVLYVWMRLVE